MRDAFIDYIHNACEYGTRTVLVFNTVRTLAHKIWEACVMTIPFTVQFNMGVLNIVYTVFQSKKGELQKILGMSASRLS